MFPTSWQKWWRILRYFTLLYISLQLNYIFSHLGNSFRKLWKNQDFSSISLVLIPFNPTNSHWILIVINIERKTIAVLDPLVTDTVWTGTSTCKGFQVGMDIMKLKFNIDFQDVKKVNIKHHKQPDGISCGVLVCFYAEQIIKGSKSFVFYVFY